MLVLFYDSLIKFSSQNFYYLLISYLKNWLNLKTMDSIKSFCTENNFTLNVTS